MIHFVVALPAEGKPLIDRYGLRRRTLRSDYPIYEGNDITLIVSGIGKVAAAAATACLHASTNDHRPGVWLNVGIAGHSQRPVGDGVRTRRSRHDLCHRGRDSESRRRAYFDPR